MTFDQVLFNLQNIGCILLSRNVNNIDNGVRKGEQKVFTGPKKVILAKVNQ
jgi:hypothetical protein